MIRVTELIKTSPRLTENKVTADGGRVVKPNHPGSPAVLPINVFANAMLNTVAKLPDGLGAPAS